MSFPPSGVHVAPFAAHLAAHWRSRAEGTPPEALCVGRDASVLNDRLDRAGTDHRISR
ncbi:hypothetical protein D3C87_1413300 [compost metagenome]